LEAASSIWLKSGRQTFKRIKTTKQTTIKPIVIPAHLDHINENKGYILGIPFGCTPGNIFRNRFSECPRVNC